MAKLPTVEEQLSDDLIVLNFEKVALSDDDFIELCADNREFLFETTAQKELVIMTPPGAKTMRRNLILLTDLEVWSRQDGKGVAFSNDTVFRLPNGARRGPDACWLPKERWNALSNEQQEKMAPFCPDFVVELMSPSDRRPYRFRMLQAKMKEYIANGALLGWLIDPYNKRVQIYTPDGAVQILENPATISGDPILPGFVFNVSQMWEE